MFMFGATGSGEMRIGLPRQKPKLYTIHTKSDDPCIGLGHKSANVTITNMQYMLKIYITQYQLKTNMQCSKVPGKVQWLM